MFWPQIFLLAAFGINISYWHSQAIGWIFFVFLLVNLSLSWQKIYRDRFGFAGWPSYIFSGFTVVNLLGLISSVFAVWYRISDIALISIYILVIALTLTAQKILAGKGPQNNNPAESHKKIWEPKQSKYIWRQVLIGIYGLIWGACLILLLVSKSSQTIYSPWQTISVFYLPLFFFLTVILLFLLLLPGSVKLKLAFIVFHSLLMHLYLPLSHIQPWGGDVWRHIGVEKLLVEQKYYPPVLFGPEYKARAVLGLQIPEAFLIPNKYAYGQLWGLTVVIQRTIGIDLITLNIWLVPVLWSLAIPIIFFYLGEVLFAERKYSLIFSFATLVPFSFQALGGLTIPVSLGYISFFWLILHWLKNWEIKDKRFYIFCALLTVLSVFGYTLHFFLVVVFLWVRYFLEKAKISFSKFQRLLYYLAAVLLVFIYFPLIEFLTGYNSLPHDLNLFAVIKSTTAEILGWYYARSPLQSDVLAQNIFFNQTPGIAFVANIFTVWKWWILPISVASIAFIFFVLWQGWRKDANPYLRLFGVLGAGLFLSYIFDWKIMQGEKLFIRRLDGYLAFNFIVLLVFGWQMVYDRFNLVAKTVRIKSLLAICAILVGSWIMVSFYASGPDLRVVSSAELKVAESIWQKEQYSAEHCVLADTWTLLALEGVSGRGIVEGGLQTVPASWKDKYLSTLSATVGNSIQNLLKTTTAANVCTIVSKNNLKLDFPRQFQEGYYLYTLNLK